MSEDACDGTPKAFVPGLVVVSTPIGNLGDMTARGRDALAAAAVVLCEDTRTTAHLLRGLGIRAARLEALHEHNEDARIDGVLARLVRGETVALVSDAGTPLLSDPGYRLVRAAIAAGHAVTAAPGANAVLTALVLSGLPPHPFLFLGFPPPRAARRRDGFRQLRAVEAAGLRATLVWHEAPHRAAETLDDLASAFGAERDAAIARELTKRFEEVRRGTLAALVASVAADPLRGEVTLLVGPSDDRAEADEAAALDRALLEALGAHSVRDAASIVAEARALPRRVVYARALELSRAR